MSDLKKIKLKKVPDWLHISDLYIFQLESDEKYMFYDIIKDTDEINSLEDLNIYLLTCDYWGVNLLENISDSCIKYINKNREKSLEIMENNLKYKNIKNLYQEINSSNYTLDFKIPKNYKNKYQIRINVSLNNILLYSCKNYNEDNNNISSTLFEKIINSIKLSEYYNDIIFHTNIYEGNEISVNAEFYMEYISNKLILSDIITRYFWTDTTITKSKFIIILNKWNKDVIINCLENFYKEITDGI